SYPAAVADELYIANRDRRLGRGAITSRDRMRPGAARSVGVVAHVRLVGDVACDVVLEGLARHARGAGLGQAVELVVVEGLGQGAVVCFDEAAAVGQNADGVVVVGVVLDRFDQRVTP
ncbi:MAG: hypothetical protein Q8L60_12010, partial [Gammaproteobacteria bacterium]|nr:hypothetical protein [Gammaproteobacteria bacterium]